MQPELLVKSTYRQLRCFQPEVLWRKLMLIQMNCGVLQVI